jgi:DNA invertase Pin-like site-specific DNA recombinase
MCYVRAYLRASTDEQDAEPARDQLKALPQSAA